MLKRDPLVRALCVGLAFAVLNLSGAVKTFTGASSKYWSNAANWVDGAKPVSGDSVVISSGFVSGDYAYSYNDIEGLTLAGLTFACPTDKSVQSSGKKIVLAEGGALGCSTAAWILLGMPIELAAGDHEMSAANRIDLGGYDGSYGKLSGAGSLTLTKGTLVCYCASSHTGGFTAKSSTLVLVFANSSLGTGCATFEAKSLLTIYDACTLPNDFAFAGRATGGNDIVIRASATISGNVTLGAHVRTSVVIADKTLRFAGTVSMPTTGTPLLISQNAANGTLAFDHPVDCANGQFWSVYARDNFVFGAAGNRIGLVRHPAGTTRFTASGASDPAGSLTMFGNAGATIYCEGAQETKRLYCADATQGSGHAVSSANGGSLKVNATRSDTFVGGLTGALSFIWNPTGAYTFTASGDCSLSGALIVSNGTMAVTKAGALANISALTVAAGATLNLSDGVTPNAQLTCLDLSASGSLVLPAETTLDVGRLYVDGVLQPDDATYTGGAAGPGVTHLDALPANLTVRARVIPGIGTRHVWNGAGLSADALENGANWQGGEAPSFGMKCLMAVVGGDSATIGSATRLNGVSVETRADFQLRGAGPLDLYWGGLAVVSNTLSLNAPVRVCGDQTWQIQSGGTIDVNMPFGDDGAAHAIVKTGRGRMLLHASNTEFTGDMIVSNGSVQVFCDEALGSPNAGRTIFRHTDVTDRGSLSSWAGDVRLGRSLVFEGAGDYFDSVAVANGHVLNLAGPVTNIGGARWFRALSGSTIVFSGGVFGDDQVVLDGDRFVLTNSPSALASNFYVSQGDVTVACANNACKEICLYTTKTKLTLACDEAFTNRPALRIVGSSRVNLNGHDLALSRLYGEAKASVTDATIASQTPATLETLTDDIANVVFIGAVTFRVAGGKPRLVGGVSTSTGTLECTGGALTLSGDAAWTAGRVLCQNAGTTLTLEDDAQLGRKVDVYIGQGAKLNLNKDVTCSRLYFYRNGAWVPQGVGSFGSTASAAETRNDDCFGGTGVLRTTHGGFLFIVR